MLKSLNFHRFVRIISLAAALCLAAGLLPLPAAAQGTKTISTPEELFAIREDPDGDYVLTADLDLSGYDHVPFPFSGTLDGAGHMILNLTVTAPCEETGITFDGNDIEYDTVFAGLFSVMTEAEVQDLILLNPRIIIDTEENCFAGCLAGSMENSTVRNVQVENAWVQLTQTAYNSGTAGLVGFGSGSFDACGFEGTLIFSDTNREENCESFLGGICATGMVDVTNCVVTLDAYASVCGYAHSGGLVGMFYDPEWSYTGTCTDNTVAGRILFYEYNPTDRRAYCEPYIGEELGSVDRHGNSSWDYQGVETDETDGILLPVTHDAAAYTAAVTAPTCTSYGYTEYICTDPECGCSYRDLYTLPVHTPGEPEILLAPTMEKAGLAHIYCADCGKLLLRETLPVHVAGDWMMVKAPSYEETGSMCLYCADCGAILETQIVERLTGAESCTLSETALTLRCKSTRTLTAELQPEDIADPSLRWHSSDPSVASVTADGTVTALGRGTAVITCTSGDGLAEATCTVTVIYAWWQWIIHTILFGFLWY